MPSKGAVLRALIDKGEHFVCGDTYSAITGRIATARSTSTASDSCNEASSASGTAWLAPAR